LQKLYPNKANNLFNISYPVLYNIILMNLINCKSLLILHCILYRMKITGRFKNSTILFILSMAGIAILLLLCIVFLLYKDVALERSLNKAAQKFAARGYTFTYHDCHVKNLNRVMLGRIHIGSENDSSRVDIDSLSMQFGILPAMIGHVVIRKLDCSKILFYYAPAKPISEPSKTRGIDNPSHTVSFSAIANRVVRRLFRAIPRDLVMDTIRIIVHRPVNDMKFSFCNSTITRGAVQSYFFTGEKSDTSAVLLEGRINRKKLSAELIAHNPGRNRCSINFMGEHPVIAGFDTLMVSFSFPRYTNKMVAIVGRSVSKGFSLEGDRLSSNTIEMNRFISSFTLYIRPRSVEIDSVSNVIMNHISFNPYVLVSKDPQLKVKLKILPVIWDAGVFFNSLPPGMFNSLIGLQATGDLHFSLDFSLDMEKIDSLQFASKLTSNNFKILSFGNDDYRILNTEFIHRFYDKGNLVASFIVGPSNSDFTSLADISPWLKTCVLTSEDGGFYYSNGFNPDAIHESLITNIKNGRFVRGGSTISMQLVKNVFLTRNKNIGRKIEELLIVWIIEQKRLVSKDRMFEVYLNIIEWGPGIYGINQASRYYFNKAPADLNLQESLFLSGIVPFPKRFKGVFEYNGVPRAYFANYMQRMKEIMVSRNRLMPEDTTGVDAHIFLTGAASNVFVLPDTLITDTLQPEEFEIFPLESTPPE
jgi:hypothetical protein